MPAIESLKCDVEKYTYCQPSYYYDLAKKLVSELEPYNNPTELKNLIRCLLFCTHSSFSLLLDIQEKFSDNKKNFRFVTFPYPMVHLPHEQHAGPFHRDQLGRNSKTIWTPLSDTDDQLNFLSWSQFGITSRVSLFFERNGLASFKTSLHSKRGSLYTFNQYLVHAGARNTSNQPRIGMTVRLLDHSLENETTLPFEKTELARLKHLFIFDDADYYKLCHEAFLIRKTIEEESTIQHISSRKVHLDFQALFGEVLSKTNNVAGLRFLSLYFFWTAIESQDQEMKRIYSQFCKFLNVERVQGLIF